LGRLGQGAQKKLLDIFRGAEMGKVAAKMGKPLRRKRF